MVKVSSRRLTLFVMLKKLIVKSLGATKTFFRSLLSILDLLEFIVAAAIGTALFLSVPFYLVFALFKSGHLFLAILVSFVVISSYGICIRDVLRKQWSVVSICVAALWTICLLLVGWTLMS
jgi:hypothetical protein